MTTITVTRTIRATAAQVFDLVAHVDNFAQAITAIDNVEYLSDIRKGVGTRFRETRVVFGRYASTELEITEYQPNHRVRLVADSHGAVWDTTFTVEDRGETVSLVMQMHARPYKLLAKVMVRLNQKLVQKAVEADMEAVKAYCEQASFAS